MLADSRELEILDIIDDHSRLLVAATARTVIKAGDVVADLHAAIARHGRPERLLTDNGAVFTGHYRGGWVALEREPPPSASPWSTPSPTTRPPAAKSNVFIRR